MRRRVATLAAAIAALGIPAGATHAATSGLAVPELGGQGGGAATLGAAGMLSNPATVGTVRGGEVWSGGEAILDVGLGILGASYAKAPNPATGESFEKVGFKEVSPFPYLAITGRPLGGPIGLGASLSVPYGRKTDFPEEGPQRYQTISAFYFSAMATGAVSVHVSRLLSFGAGASYVHTRLWRHVRADLGLSILRLDPDSNAPLEDPFLEGDLRVDNATGHGFAFHAGAMLRPLPNLYIGVAFQSGTKVKVSGDSILIPSMDLALESHGEATFEFRLPPVVNVGARWLVTPAVTIGAEVQWLGWSTLDTLSLEFAESELRGSNAELQALLWAVGVEDVEALLNSKKTIARGARNTASGRVLVEVTLPSPWLIRAMVGYDHHAIPSTHVNVGNLDFDSLSFGLGVERSLGKRWAVYLTATQYVLFARTVTDSAYDPYASAESGLSAQPANGKYTGFLHRVGLGLRFKFGKDLAGTGSSL